MRPDREPVASARPARPTVPVPPLPRFVARRRPRRPVRRRSRQRRSPEPGPTRLVRFASEWNDAASSCPSRTSIHLPDPPRCPEPPPTPCDRVRIRWLRRDAPDSDPGRHSPAPCVARRSPPIRDPESSMKTPLVAPSVTTIVTAFGAPSGLPVRRRRRVRRRRHRPPCLAHREPAPRTPRHRPPRRFPARHRPSVGLTRGFIPGQRRSLERRSRPHRGGETAPRSGPGVCCVARCGVHDRPVAEQRCGSTSFRWPPRWRGAPIRHPRRSPVPPPVPDRAVRRGNGSGPSPDRPRCVDPTRGSTQGPTRGSTQGLKQGPKQGPASRGSWATRARTHPRARTASRVTGHRPTNRATRWATSFVARRPTSEHRGGSP